MISIFYDFETSDAHFLGQILNYCFIAVDEHLKPIAELSGLISIDRLQLPSPGAIRANRVDVIAHQKAATDTEIQGAKIIIDFLMQVLRDTGRDVRLIGFNSARFDLPYFRTTCIRNGLNPYLRLEKGPKLLNGDLFLALRKLLTTNSEFGLLSLKEDPQGLVSRSLSLEHITTQLGLLTGVQTHESREDVLLTIELAKIIKSRFGLDITTFTPYEGHQFHKTVRSGKIFFQRVPEYELVSERDFSVIPVTLLDYTASGALWIDLIGYEEGKGKESIFWRNTNDGVLFLEEPAVDPIDFVELAKKAIEQFKTVTVGNFFERATCDIEQDIYRLDFSARDALSAAIWKNDSKALKALKDPDADELFRRFRLRHFSLESKEGAKGETLLKQYGLYRYGGKAKLDKKSGTDQIDPWMHPTLASYIEEIKVFLAQSESEEEKSRMRSLMVFYEQSDLFRLCGQDLLQ